MCIYIYIYICIAEAPRRFGRPKGPSYSSSTALPSPCSRRDRQLHYYYMITTISHVYYVTLY